MTDVTVNYNYAIPNEQFINDFSDGLTKQFTYIGPEELTVTVRNHNGSAYTQQLDGPVYDDERVVTINVTTNPELLAIADLLWGRPYDHELTFTSTTLEDGTEYAEPDNQTIHDYYFQPNYDIENAAWITDLVTIEKDALSPKMRTYLAKADQFIEILDQFTLPDAETTQLTAYKAAVELYRSKVATPWKYPSNNPFETDAPRIPMELVSRINEIKTSGFDAMMTD